MKKIMKLLFMAICLLSAPLGMSAQSLVFHLPDGGLSTVSLPATFTISPSSDKLIIESGDTRVELDKNRILAMTYSARKGDVNDDMAVDVADIATIISIMAGGGEPSPTLDVSSTSLSFESSADSKQVEVACNSSWTASSSQSWCTVSPVSGTGADTRDPHYWSNSQNSHLYSTWSGLAFEMLCLNHAEQLKKALGISGVTANVCTWFGKGANRSAQIDMLIDRADKTINICEMKFHNRVYSMTAKDEADIEWKVSTFIEATGTDKNVIVTMITVKGLERNEHSSVVQRELTLDELFC